MEATPRSPRVPTFTALAGVLLALYYAAFLRPFAHRVEALDAPLTNTWNAFLQTNATFAACAGLNLANAATRVQTLQTALTNLEAVTQLALTRLELPADIRARLAQPFQLIDFQNERVRLAESLLELAKEKAVAIDPAALNGFPEYSVDLRDPRLLWPRLHFTHQLLLAAVHSKLGGVRALNQLPTLLHDATNPRQTDLVEIPMRIEVFGSADALAIFLASLPLRGRELAHLGAAQTLTNKPAFFIDQALARKHSPERPHDAFLELTVAAWAIPNTP